MIYLFQLGFSVERIQAPIGKPVVSQPKFRFQYIIKCEKWKQTAILEFDNKTGNITTIDKKEFLHAVDITIRGLAADLLHPGDECMATVDVPVDSSGAVCDWKSAFGENKIQKGEM